MVKALAVARNQVEDYAQRKGWSVREAERRLAPVLNYDPLALAREASGVDCVPLSRTARRADPGPIYPDH